MTLRGRRIVALVPMKAHSSRVPEKNFRQFVDKPLCRWILDTLSAVEAIDEIVINTDAFAELAEVGVVSGGKITLRQRSPENCGDDVSMNLVLADDVANTNADIYIMTHTTNPLLRSETVFEGLNKFLDVLETGECDSMFSVTKVQTRFYDAACKAINHDPNNLIPTQNLEPWYEENSNLYFFTAQSFAATKARIGAKPTIFEISKLECSDIDTPQDWEIAQAMAQYLYH